jgi:hypothetical protein
LKLPAAAKIDRAILRRVGNTVELSLVGLRSKSALNEVLGKIPAGFRPTYHQSQVTADKDFNQLRVSVAGGTTAELSANQPADSDSFASTSTSLVWLTNDDWPSKLPGKESRY